MIVSELRRAVRALIARPSFFIAAIASLAFGIGANVTVFTIVNALLLRPLPYEASDRLLFIRSQNPRLHVSQGSVSLAELDAIRGDARSLVGAGVFREADFNIGGEQPRRIRGTVVSASVLPTLGVSPARGHGFADRDDRSGAPPRVLISDNVWRAALGGRDDVVGSTIRIDGMAFEIVGVMPVGFQVPERSDIWLPLGAAASSGFGAVSSSARVFQVVARLSQAASLSNARAELATLAAGLEFNRSAADRGWTLSAISAEQERGESARPAVYLLFSLVTAVLLVACANLASLLIARAVGRHRELAIRGALGASRVQLIWHGLAESIVLAGAGGVGALVVAVLGVRATRLAFPAGTLPFWLRFELDGGVLAYALGLSLVTALAFGLAPALWAARRAPVSGLLYGSRSATGTLRQRRLTGALVAGQVAVALVLLVSASVLGAALVAMRTASLGYEPAGLITADLEPRGRRYVDADGRRALFENVRDNIARVSGVTGVSAFDLWGNAALDVGTSGAPRRVESPIYSVLTGYFETMHAPIAAGRSIQMSDRTGAQLVAVVNETFAAKQWPNESAIGKPIKIVDGGAGDRWLTVVGVAGDIRRNPADLEREPHLYISASQLPPRRLRFIVRHQIPVAPDALSKATLAVDADEVMGPTLTMNQQIAEWTAPSRFFARSLGAFALVALLIAAVGIYGVVSGAVAARTREFGIRRALGATAGNVVRLAVDRGAKLALFGAAVGLVGALAVSRLLTTLPFGVERVNASVVSGAVAVLVAIALAAVYVPARRAGRVEPTVALSEEL